MTDKREFIRGAVLLSLSGIFVKLLGAVLRIPLANKLGEGMAYYNVAYTVYAIFLVLATAGIPVAISSLVSERVSVGNQVAAHKVFVTALKLMAVIGIFSFLICFFGAEQISAVIEIPGAAVSLRAIASALCIVPLLAAFRGYFQGQQKMEPTAISETVEQTVRVVVGLSLGFMLYEEGLDIAAAGATFGAAAGAVAGILVMGFIYAYSARRNHKRRKSSETKEAFETQRLAESSFDILKKIAWIAVPIVIGAEIMPLMSAVDMTLIVSRLQETGWQAEDALNLYSQYGAYCDTLISLPQTFTQAIAVSLVPSIAAFFWQKRMDKVRENIQISMRMTMLMACPCAVGLFVLARPIMMMLYFDQTENAMQAAPTLQVMTVGVILLAITQTATGALQSIGMQMKPVRNLAIGAVIKIAVTYVLVGVPWIHVRGAAVGTNAAYLTALIMNLYAVKKETGVRFDGLQTYVKPAFASVLMGICVYAAYNVISAWAGNTTATLASILLGILVYGAAVLKLKAVTASELRALPFGEFMSKIFRV